MQDKVLQLSKDFFQFWVFVSRCSFCLTQWGCCVPCSCLWWEDRLRQWLLTAEEMSGMLLNNSLLSFTEASAWRHDIILYSRVDFFYYYLECSHFLGSMWAGFSRIDFFFLCSNQHLKIEWHPYVLWSRLVEN